LAVHDRACTAPTIKIFLEFTTLPDQNQRKLAEIFPSQILCEGTFSFI